MSTRMSWPLMLALAASGCATDETISWSSAATLPAGQAAAPRVILEKPIHWRALTEVVAIAVVRTGDPTAPVDVALFDGVVPRPSNGLVVTGVFTRGLTDVQTFVTRDGVALIRTQDQTDQVEILLRTNRGDVGLRLLPQNAAPVCPTPLVLPPIPQDGGTLDPLALGIEDPDGDPLAATFVQVQSNVRGGLVDVATPDAPVEVLPGDLSDDEVLTAVVGVSDGRSDTVCEAPLPVDRAPVCGDTPHFLEVPRGTREVLVTAADLCIDPEGAQLQVEGAVDADGVDRLIQASEDGTALIEIPEGQRTDLGFTISIRDAYSVRPAGVVATFPNAAPACPPDLELGQVQDGDVFDAEALGAVDPDGDPLRAVEIVQLDRDGTLASRTFPPPTGGGTFTITSRDIWFLSAGPPTGEVDVTFEDDLGASRTCTFSWKDVPQTVCGPDARFTGDLSEPVELDLLDACVTTDGSVPEVFGIVDADGSDVPFAMIGDGRVQAEGSPDPGSEVWQALTGPPIGTGTFTITTRDWDPFFLVGSTPNPIPESGGVVDIGALGAVNAAGDPLEPVRVEVITPDGETLQDVSGPSLQFDVAGAPVQDQANGQAFTRLVVTFFDNATGQEERRAWDVKVDEAPSCEPIDWRRVPPGATEVTIPVADMCADPEGGDVQVGAIQLEDGSELPFDVMPDGSVVAQLPAPLEDLQNQKLSVRVTDGVNALNFDSGPHFTIVSRDEFSAL